jgi:hypothetical protein
MALVAIVSEERYYSGQKKSHLVFNLPISNGKDVIISEFLPVNDVLNVAHQVLHHYSTRTLSSPH